MRRLRIFLKLFHDISIFIWRILTAPLRHPQKTYFRAWTTYETSHIKNFVSVMCNVKSIYKIVYNIYKSVTWKQNFYSLLQRCFEGQKDSNFFLNSCTFLSDHWYFYDFISVQLNTRKLSNRVVMTPSHTNKNTLKVLASLRMITMSTRNYAVTSTTSGGRGVVDSL